MSHPFDATPINRATADFIKRAHSKKAPVSDISPSDGANNILNDYENLSPQQTHAINILFAAQIIRQVAPECADELSVSATFMASYALKPVEFEAAKAIVDKLLDRLRGAS